MRIFILIKLALIVNISNLYAAEAGMPQLDPKYWASQVFWLIIVFSLLYVSISKFFIPKIKNNLNDRDNKIKSDLDSARELKDLSEKRQKEYENIIENTKKEISKILIDSKNKLDEDIKLKKQTIEKEIEKEISKAENEIRELKKNSLDSITSISEEITSKIIKDISGDQLNGSSIKAAVQEISKEQMSKYL